MSDQSELLQALEHVLQEQDVEYKLQRAEVGTSTVNRDGERQVLDMDIRLTIGRGSWVDENDS